MWAGIGLWLPLQPIQGQLTVAVMTNYDGGTVLPKTMQQDEVVGHRSPYLSPFPYSPSYKEAFCPRQCSGHGECDLGFCRCERMVEPGVLQICHACDKWIAVWIKARCD